MKKSLIVFLLLVALDVDAQNVGIGNSNPAEKLDVTGNINVTGTIKANGVDGTPNQVLMKNNAGVMEWGDMSAFKNFLTYYSNGTFTVPAGVTKIMVELWGGGGGGNYYCGGGGGGYVKAQLDVSPGVNCTIQIGVGGSNANSATAANGGSTSFAIGAIVQYSATGGRGAVYVGSSYFNPGLGGAAVYSSNPRSYIVVPGDRGTAQTKRYGQNSPTAYFEITNGGNGGGTYKYPEAGGSGAQNITNYTSESTVMTNAGGTDGKVPGGGGAGGLVSLGASVVSGSGANGMLVVYY